MDGDGKAYVRVRKEQKRRIRAKWTIDAKFTAIYLHNSKNPMTPMVLKWLESEDRSLRYHARNCRKTKGHGVQHTNLSVVQGRERVSQGK